LKNCIFCEKNFESNNWRCPYCGESPSTNKGFLSFVPKNINYKDGFSKEFYQELFFLENDNYWFRSRNHMIIWALSSYFHDKKNFLEVGCGNGFVLSGIRNAFPELMLYGSEIYYEGLSFANQRLRNITLYQIDAHHIPFENEFDVVGAFDVLEHIEDDSVALEQIYKATKPGGGIIITVPQHRFLWSAVDALAFHKRRYSCSDLQGKVEAAGFEIARVTSFVSLLIPFMILSRVKRNFMYTQFNKYNPNAEYEVNPFFKRILENILTLERIAIKRGISFPIGGSLLLIAKKSYLETEKCK
jgi:SAM-dependent methyltransferase